MIFGVDTAKVGGNKDVSWTRAKAEGPISFAILRSNWGTAEDGFFVAEWDRVQAAGLVAGAYLFLRFGPGAPEPTAQAKAMVGTLGPRLQAGRDLPPTVDVEFPDGAQATGKSAGELIAGVLEARKVLEDGLGIMPMIYSSARVWRDDLQNQDSAEAGQSPLWVKRYPFKQGKPAVRDPALAGSLEPQVPPPWRDAENWWIHQYQGDAVGLPGFPTGNVDMNRFHVASHGDRGGHVTWLQTKLGKAGHAAAVDGTFGDATEQAVRAFQTAKGLVADGIVGPRTFAALAWV